MDELPPRLIGDKAWDSGKHNMILAARNIEPIAPERLFAWLKRFRRVAIRWDEKAENDLGFVHLAAMTRLLRRFCDVL